MSIHGLGAQQALPQEPDDVDAAPSLVAPSDAADAGQASAPARGSAAPTARDAFAAQLAAQLGSDADPLEVDDGAAEGVGGTGGAAVAEALDTDRVFRGGRLRWEEVLGKLTQFDHNDATVADADRCGATSLVAAAIVRGGARGIVNLCRKLEAMEPGRDAELTRIIQRTNNGRLTYGDLGVLSEKTYDLFRVTDRQGEIVPGLPGFRLREMFVAIGAQPISEDARLPDEFEPGQVWPILIDNDDDYFGNHWVLGGKTEDGRPFFFDPYPDADEPQLYFQENDDGYNWYVNRANRADTGPAARTEAEYERARRRYVPPS